MPRTQPTPSALSQPWFDACKQGQLLLQQCSACHRYQFYPRIVCSSCGASDLSWSRASGRGVIASFTVVHRAVSEAYDAPYVVALVDLAEGPRMMTHIVDFDTARLAIGAAVKLSFESWSDAISMPVFRLQETLEDREHPRQLQEVPRS